MARLTWSLITLTTIPILKPDSDIICLYSRPNNSDLQVTLPRTLPVTQLLPLLSVESWKGCVEDLQSLYVFPNGCCYIPDLPVREVSLRQTSNHMPRLDCPSVSAETPNP